MIDPWNLLVYIATDDRLYEDAVVSLKQITKESRHSNLRILVQLDGPGDNYAIRYQCAGGKRSVVWESVDGSNPDPSVRLEDFLNAALPVDRFKEKVFLVLWGHGDGLDHVYLYGNREHTPPIATAPKLLQNPEPDTGPATIAEGSAPMMENAILIRNDAEANLSIGNAKLGAILQRFTNRTGKKIDVLGLDACLMGMAEVCQELVPSVSILIGSDEVSPSQSWPYDLIVRDIGSFPAVDARTLSIMVVSRFLEKYSASESRNRVSLTAYSLKDWTTFTKSIRGLAEALMGEVQSGRSNSRILRARDFAKTPNRQGSIDLARFCLELEDSFDEGSSIADRAQEVIDRILNTPHVVYHREAGEGDERGFYGLAIYFPDVLPLLRSQIEQGYQLVSPSSLLIETGRDPDLKGGKTVTTENTKTVTVENTKTVVIEHTKHLDGAAADSRITGSEIPWDCYSQLEFNKVTKWAGFLETLLSRSNLPAERS